MISIELLHQQQLFRDLPVALLEEVRHQVRLVEYARREYVLHKGGLGDALLMLLTGRLQVISMAESGKEVGINFIEPGDYFGEISLIDGGPRSASVVAVMPSVVGFLPKAQALWLFHNQPSIAARVQAKLCATIRKEIQFRSSLGGAKAFARIYAVLCNNPVLKANHPAALEDLPGQNAIASMANVSRETVSRALTALARAGVVEKNGRQMLIKDPQTLQKLATGALEVDQLAEQTPAPQVANRRKLVITISRGNAATPIVVRKPAPGPESAGE